MPKFSQVTNKIIYLAFLSLAVVTPLLFTTQTTEIYEIPKMYFVYLVSTILLTLTFVKFLIDKKWQIPKSAVVISFAAFILVQIIATLFSQDRFTSIFGYPTRLNGGLISQSAYFIIFLSGVINLDSQKAKNLLFAIVFAAVAVSLWGIPSHFGADPSCLVLTGKLTSACWQKEFDPTLRIFSTLGQPNWLASYLVLILPVPIVLALIYKESRAKLTFIAASAVIFFAIILTNSRAGLLGLITSLFLFTIFLGIKTIKTNFKVLGAIALAFLIITLLFGTNLNSRLKDLTSTQSSITGTNTQDAPAPTQSSLTSGGTESSQIRLIVWRGAIDIFKSSPIIGTGPETFVSSYYKFRPSAHNQTTEWEFFYNKAHNEFLNYLANTGILGLISYLTFLILILISIFRQKNATLVQKSVFASICGYLVTIFFGFSTVATQTIFILLVVSALQESVKFQTKIFLPNNLIQKALILTTFIIGLFTLTLFGRLYLAEALTKRAQTTSGTQELLAYRNAITTSPVNSPYYFSDFANSIASYLSEITNEENKSKLVKEIDSLNQQATNIAPNNFLINQRIAKTYLLVSQEDSGYTNAANLYAQKITQMAPTNPTTFLLLAKVQITNNQTEQAISSIKKALELKPDYIEAQQLLEEVTKKPIQ